MRGVETVGAIVDPANGCAEGVEAREYSGIDQGDGGPDCIRGAAWDVEAGEKEVFRSGELGVLAN